MGRNGKQLTPEDIIAWAQTLVGTPVAQIAKGKGCSRDTVYRMIERAKEFVGDDADIRAMRQSLFAFFPDVLRSLRFNLAANDVQTTLAFLTKLGIWDEPLKDVANAIRESGSPTLAVHLDFSSCSESERKEFADAYRLAASSKRF